MYLTASQTGHWAVQPLCVSWVERHDYNSVVVPPPPCEGGGKAPRSWRAGVPRWELCDPLIAKLCLTGH